MTSSSNAESPTTAPNSVDQSNSKHSLSKDKQCPFCHQSFTSSSLGRHLDLYIKEKNPKPPDGVHDVESIRKIREKITRRHARGLSSTTAAGSGSPSSRKGSAGDGNNNTTRSGGSSAAASARPQPLEPTPGQPTPTMQQGKTNGTFNERPEQQININRMNWHATGVMNDIPPRLAGPDGRADNDVAATNSPLNTSAANFAGKTQQQQQQQQSTSGTPAADQDRSNSICFDNVPNTNKTPVEQALKDILISIQLAVGRSQHPQPFDFDIFEHSFPALCLRMLPVPKNLFSTTPTTSVETWSALDPPSRDCYDALRESLRNRLKIYYSMFPPTELRLPRTRADGEAMIARKVESEKGKYMKHLSDVFERWEALSQKEKDRVWLLELARVYAWEIQEHAGTRRKLDKAEDDIEALKVQIERMTGQLQQQQ
ncbi:MAG: hypothetical protein M1831_000753, partial [Alyxoria varia]